MEGQARLTLMPLEAGMTIGVYEVVAKIGEGGMGEVYRARDTTLDRDVALKVLPEAFTSDPDRLARFEREAKVLASLNHPNIGSIYGLEEAEGGTFRALVLELVEGPTLADRIRQGPIPIDDALPIARQIAEALEAAHEAGVIHRDLKPANIKVREDGTVKVLDFGLAKALDPTSASATADPSNSPTLTAAATQMGVIVGTAAYMSPEQARGRPVDRRADIWAFGVVLYEMLTATRAFQADDVSLTLAEVMKSEPNWDRLPVLPPLVESFLRQCFQKDPRQRTQAIGDVRLALEGAFETVAHQAPDSVAVEAPVWRQPWAAAVAAALLTAVVAGLIGWTQWPIVDFEPREVLRFSHDLPRGHGFSSRSAVAASPDGRSFVYTTARGLQLRTMDGLEARLLVRTDAGLTTPFYSPDGSSVGYFESGRLKRISLSAGVSSDIGPATPPYGASWAADNTILYSQPEGILRVPANGGTPETVVRADPGERFDGPQLLPDGRTALFAVTRGTWDEADIVVASLATGARTVLVAGGSGARYLPTGHLVYVLDDDLFAVAFDPDNQTVAGESVALLTGVMRAGKSGAAANYGVSDSGTLIYATGVEAARRLVWLGRDGQPELLSTPPRSYINVSLSPDGQEAALEIAQDGESDLWVAELARGTLNPLTSEGGFVPLWSPDGRRVVYAARRDGRWQLRSRAADGTGESDLLASFDETVLEVRPSSWLPDGSTLAFDVKTPDTGQDIGLLSVNAPGEWRPLIQTSADESKAAVSPDGRWIAYQTNDFRGSITGQVYLQRYPDLGNRRQVSVGAELHFNPTWSWDGSALFFVRMGATQAVMRSTVGEDAAGAPVIGPAEFQLAYRWWDSPTGTFRTWDLSPDDDRFLMIAYGDDVYTDFAESPAQIITVQNWFEELERLVATAQ